MTDLFAVAAQWLETNRRNFCASVVTYCRGELTASLPATIGKTTFEVENTFGVMERFESRDFIILASDLLLGGFGGLTPGEVMALTADEFAALLASDPATPQPGDQIQETAGAKTLSYQLFSPGHEPLWRWSDSFRNAIRAHTKLVAQS